MAQDYPKEQLWKLYEALPEDLKEAIFSERTADAIYDICQRNGLKKEMSDIAKYTGYVMLGLLAPNDFQKTLAEELKLENDVAKKVALEINRFVFFPIKSSLEALYKIEIEKPIGPTKESSPEIKPTAKQKRDIYREPIE